MGSWLCFAARNHPISSSDPVHEALTELSRFFVGDRSVQDTLHRVSELAERALPSATMTGITMLVDEKPTTAVFTDPLSPEIDEAQYTSGRGPCLDAFRTQQVLTITCTENEGRWPEFAAVAAKHGILSTMSLPMVAAGRGVGAMNFYARTDNAFGEREVEVGLKFAEQAAIVLANADAYWTAHSLSENLNEAMQSRAVIEQAKGILMAQSGLNADEAFDLLRRASQRENRKLRDVAIDIVERTQRTRTKS